MQLTDRRRRFYLYAREAWRRVSRRLVVGRISAMRFSGNGPDRLIVAPTDLRAVDPFVAEEILEGRFVLAGRVLETHGRSPFSLELPSRIFAERLHSFSWLRHIRASRNDVACANARNIVDGWIEMHGRRIFGIAWDPDVIAQRIIAWLSHSTVALHGAEGGFYRRFMKSLAFQIRYLKLIAPYTPDGEVRLRVRIALALASVSMPVRAAIIKREGQNLDYEIERQILPDGGHVSRDPRAALNLLLDLLPLRQTYINLGHDVPARLIPAIDRMYPALRFFRHQGGDLALFNGATATLANELMSVLRYDETAGQPFKALPHINYHRLSAGQTVVLMDTGFPQSVELSRSAHAGCLSFEMSSGKYRFIINCGSPKFAGKTYRQMSRATAAHSTVTLNETSSSRLSSSRFLGPVIISGVKSVTVNRREDGNGGDWLTAAHDGYVKNFGYRHEREIGINAAGTKIKGRDRFIRPEPASRLGDGAVRACIRFHIHPAIALVREDDETVSLQAPDGDNWMFAAPGLNVAITDDVFFADASGMRASQQIEIEFSVAERPEIHWVLTRSE